MRQYSTSEAARELGIHPITLHHWVSERKFAAPKKQRIGGVVVRLWTERDVERVRKYKEANYRKGRGRKKAPKKSGNR
jgi:DNA-binding transcriptional MerR regulator